eukprot:scaffold5772_cov101-Cylindrotheca_fusiformis.AAC.7
MIHAKTGKKLHTFRSECGRDLLFFIWTSIAFVASLRSTTVTHGFVMVPSKLKETPSKRQSRTLCPLSTRYAQERPKYSLFSGLDSASGGDIHADEASKSNEESTVPVRLDAETSPEVIRTSSDRENVLLMEAPTISQILRFAISAVAVFLCGPILSLIDTAAVGLLSGSVEQAALNPAVSVTEYSALLIAFMYTGTTNLIAAAHEKDRRGLTKCLTVRNFIAALQLSGIVGASFGVALLLISVPLLNTMIGNSAIDPSIFSAALKYVRIRALGMPAAALIGTSQAACLGMKDSRSPLYVLLAAAVVNFVGDLLLVGRSNQWFGGAAGAAWATIISQYAASFFFLRLLCSDRIAEKKSGFNRLVSGISHYWKKDVQDTGRSDKQPPTPDWLPAKGLLRGRFRPSLLLRLPSKESISGFFPYVVPVTSTQVGRVSSYVSMNHVISSALGPTSMAAQQIILSLWNCLYPVGESLSLTAQSFVPAITERPLSQEDRAYLMKKTLLNFWKSGLIFGSGLFVAVLCIPILNPLLTSDPKVVAMVNTVVPLLLVIYSTLGLFTSSEGILLGQKDLSFLGTSYASFFFIVPYFMLRVLRTIMWAIRALYLLPRNDQQTRLQFPLKIGLVNAILMMHLQPPSAYVLFSPAHDFNKEEHMQKKRVLGKLDSFILCNEMLYRNFEDHTMSSSLACDHSAMSNKLLCWSVQQQYSTVSAICEL